MPAFVTCRGRGLEKRWNVGSDDFVIPAFVSIVVGLFTIVLVCAVLAYFYVIPGCPDVHIPPLLYGSFFALLPIKMATEVVEVIIMSISRRGTIWKPKPRRMIAKYIYVRIILAISELLTVIVCSVAVYDPAVTDQLIEECSGYKKAILSAQILVAFLWLLLFLFVIQGLLFVDPLGLFTPGLLQHLSFLDTTDNVGDLPSPDSGDPKQSLSPDFMLKEPSLTTADTFQVSFHYLHRAKRISSRIDPNAVPLESLQRQYSVYVGHRGFLRRLQAICCCLGVGGHRSRGNALEDIARALYVMLDFKDVDLVLSDVISGLVLLNRDQKEKKKRRPMSLVKKFREVTFKAMPRNQIPPGYEYKPPEEFNFGHLNDRLLFEDMIHYMHFALGIYGWPLQVFMNLCCGFCKLSRFTCCVCNYRCCNSRVKEHYIKEDCCMCGVAAMRLQSGITEDDILFASYENKIYHAPFSVCLDHSMLSVVISVRGTLSIKDALTDMSFTLKNIPVRGWRETYVHGGMYRAAWEIKQTLEKKKVLEDAFNKYKGYQLVVTGHSLGAGVASVLALLLKPIYKDLVCYSYSPPGCIFSYPLAVYTQSFITSIVLGNDIVPRISFRALLHLKQSVRHLLIKCKIPKYRVLFQPNLCDRLRCCTTNTADYTVTEDIESAIINEDTTQRGLHQALFSTSARRQVSSGISRGINRAISRGISRSLSSRDDVTPMTLDDALELCRPEDRERFMPAFPPGRILHIEVEENAKVCCLGWCYPNKMKVYERKNEDFCVIEVDRGMVQDHLPNEVLSAMLRCKEQLIDECGYIPEQLEKFRKSKLEERQKRQEAMEKTVQTGQFVFPRINSPTDLPTVVTNGEQENNISPTPFSISLKPRSRGMATTTLSSISEEQGGDQIQGGRQIQVPVDVEPLRENTNRIEGGTVSSAVQSPQVSTSPRENTNSLEGGSLSSDIQSPPSSDLQHLLLIHKSGTSTHDSHHLSPRRGNLTLPIYDLDTSPNLQTKITDGHVQNTHHKQEHNNYSETLV